jgi:hypothetical protein
VRFVNAVAGVNTNHGPGMPGGDHLALLDFIGHPDRASRQQHGPDNQPQSRSPNGQAG